jgi:hypothetical protein
MEFIGVLRERSLEGIWPESQDECYSTWGRSLDVVCSRMSINYCDRSQDKLACFVSFSIMTTLHREDRNVIFAVFEFFHKG